MSALKKPRNREERLERCLRDVLDILCEREEYMTRHLGVDPESDSPELATLKAVFARIGRTLRPRPITVKQMHNLLSKTAI